MTTASKGQYCPETDAQSLWEIIGRVNALHDVMLDRTHAYFSSSDREVCLIMGFLDVIAEAESEKASAGNTD